jgi:Flp pilus assembly protein TadG
MSQRRSKISNFSSRRRCAARLSRPASAGQAMVETAIAISVVLLILFGGLQLALIFNAALAVSEYSYVSARYAAVHGTGSKCDTSYASTIEANVPTPPTICTSGFDGCSGGAGLSISAISCTTSSGSSDSTITEGDQLTVTISYNLSTGNKLFLPSTFLGYSLPFISTFSTTPISNSTSVMVE